MTSSPGVPATTESARCPSTIDVGDIVELVAAPCDNREPGHRWHTNRRHQIEWDDADRDCLTPGFPVTAPNPEPARCGVTTAFSTFQDQPINVFRCDRVPRHGGEWHDGASTDPSQPLARAAWPVVPAAASATTAGDSGCSIRRVTMLDPTQAHDCDEVHRHYAEGIADAIAECEARDAEVHAELRQLRDGLRVAFAAGYGAAHLNRSGPGAEGDWWRCWITAEGAKYAQGSS